MKHPSTIASELNAAMQSERQWFETWNNVIDLAEWLDKQDRLGNQRYYMLRKPWKWESEWKEFQATKLARRN